jgi:hypothetical protein
MAEIRFSCSGCGATLQVSNPELAGKKLKCGRCAVVTVIPSLQADPAASQPRPAQAAPAVRSKPKPPSAASAKDETLLELRAPATTTKPTLPTPDKASPASPEPEPRKSGPRAPSRKGLRLLLIAAVVLVTAAVGYLGYVYFGLSR